MYKYCLDKAEEVSQDENEEQNEEHSNQAKRQAVPLPGPQVLSGAASSPLTQALPGQLPAAAGVSNVYDD